ncbi:MAG: plastocyanin/azurin family copper-binding protein [Mycobacteriales bacterium]
MRSRRLTAALLFTPLLMITACGEAVRDKPNAKLATPRPTPAFTASIGSPPPSPTSAAPTKAASPGATASEAPAAPAVPGQITATVGNQFEPATIEVKVGTEVTWVNSPGGFHSVTGGTPEAPDPASVIGDNQLEGDGATVKKMFDKAGTYEYFCKPHGSLGMKGKVVVA